MRRVCLMILAVGLLAAYANAALVTFTLDNSTAHPGKYKITASVTGGSAGLASFKVTAPRGQFAGANIATPATAFNLTVMEEDEGGFPVEKTYGPKVCAFNLLQGIYDNDTIAASIAEASQDTVAEAGVGGFTDNTTPVLAFGIGQGVVNMRTLCPTGWAVDMSYLNYTAANPVVLVDNLNAVPTLMIGNTLETLETMVAGQTYSGKVGTLANVFVTEGDNDTQAADVALVNVTAPDPTPTPAEATVSGTVSYTAYEFGYALTSVTVNLVKDSAVVNTATLSFDGSGTDQQVYSFKVGTAGSYDVVIDQDYNTGWFGASATVEAVLGSTVTADLALTHALPGDSDMIDGVTSDDYFYWLYGYTSGDPEAVGWMYGDYDGIDGVTSDDYFYWLYGYTL